MQGGNATTNVGTIGFFSLLVFTRDAAPVLEPDTIMLRNGGPTVSLAAFQVMCCFMTLCVLITEVTIAHWEADSCTSFSADAKWLQMDLEEHFGICVYKLRRVPGTSYMHYTAT